jgi:hypothetical protein
VELKILTELGAGWPPFVEAWQFRSHFLLAKEFLRSIWLEGWQGLSCEVLKTLRPWWSPQQAANSD